jgi:hypothetical protein
MKIGLKYLAVREDISTFYFRIQVLAEKYPQLTTQAVSVIIGAVLILRDIIGRKAACHMTVTSCTQDACSVRVRRNRPVF